MASAKIKARTNIKFMVKLGWKNSQIIDSLEQVYVCVENIDAVRDLIEKDRRITTESVADTLNISVGSAHTILVDSLGLSKLSARWVPRLLRPDQQGSRADLSMEILNKWDENTKLFLQRIVTGDEPWFYQYDPEDKTQSKQWLPRGGSGPVKAKSERSRGKVMATVFWDAEGILLVDFLENKKTISAVCYEEILRKLSKKISEKRPGKLLRRVLFHHDNALAYGARQTRAVLREFRWEIIRHPPYSPDLAPSDFFLFPNLKKSLKVRSYITSSIDKDQVLRETFGKVQTLQQTNVFLLVDEVQIRLNAEECSPSSDLCKEGPVG
ncbi:Transposase type 1 [Trinorchestia longiramus]|nr:Transposase type 1 [Trinorchestia longiramus]